VGESNAADRFCPGFFQLRLPHLESLNPIASRNSSSVEHVHVATLCTLQSKGKITKWL
jgi:hypothetical protein